MPNDPLESARRASPQPASDADAVLAACRLLVGISVRSISAVQDEVTIVQLRILTVLASHGAMTLSDVAAATGLHISRASRTCDRMVSADLIDRSDDPDDRRNLRLTLRPAGTRIVAAVAGVRRATIEPALEQLTAESRRALVTALSELTSVAGEPAEADLWALGWTT